MREKIRQKPLVAVLLPIFFLLVGFISVHQWSPLKADDQNAHLVDAKVNGEKIDDSFSVTEESILIELSTEKAQVLKFLESDRYEVTPINEEGKVLPTEEISNEKLSNYLNLVEADQKSTEGTETAEQTTASSSESVRQTSVSQEVEEIATQLLYIKEEGKKIPYLLLDKEETIWLRIVNKRPDEATTITLEIPNTGEKQTLISFSPKKKETIETSKKKEVLESSEESKESSESEKQSTNDSSDEKTTASNSKEKKGTSDSASETTSAEQTKEEKKRSLAIEQLLKKDYTEKDSFKPIELYSEEPSSRAARSGGPSPISVTGAKMTIKTGTDYFDVGNDTPGYDSSAENDIVRSFDSVIYLLTFSLEASDPTTTYSDIKYRVDMELPDAYALDSSGKQRFNAEVVDSENGELVDTSATTKTSKGFVESTIDANGQILLPMIVNVYGAQHNTPIKPTMKITVISAKNDKTGETEEVNLTYDQESMNELKLKETKVSAKSSIKPTITKGVRKPITDIVSGLTGVDTEWEVFGVGVTLGLKAIDDRTSADFRGATFPNGEIKVQINSENFYQTSLGADKISVPVSESSSFTTHTRPVYAITSSIATSETTGWNKHLYISSAQNIPEDILELNVPRGKSEQILTSEPNVSVEDKKKIGVYDSGNIDITNSNLTMTLSNSDYEPIYNPYTYTLTGKKTNDNEKIFSSSMMIVQWSKSYLLRKGGGILSTNLKISSISYEGQTQMTSETTSVADAMSPEGDAVNIATFTKNVNGSYLGLSSTGSWANSTGDGTVGQGESNIYFGGASIDFITAVREVQKIIRWNANSFEYDLSRKVYAQSESEYGDYIESKTRYGVGKTKDYPALSVSSKSELEGQYNWYSTPEEAATHGKISAVMFFYSKVGASLGDWSGAPLKVVGKTGAFDEEGNPNVGMSNSYWYSSKGELLAQDPADGQTYIPTVFDSSGNSLTAHNSLQGDSIFIKPFRIETTTTPEKPTYKTNEIVDWNVKGNILTNTDTDYGVKLTSTLPAGLKYELNSSTDGYGTPLPEPAVVNNVNGTTTLIWNFSNVNPSKGDSVEVKFKTRPILKELIFNSSALSTMTVDTIGDIWLESNPNQKDTSKEILRSSYGQIQLYQMQQIVLTKEVDKSHIEVGTNDPADSSATNDITYKITLENYSSDKLLNVKVVDELPYVGDDFGTAFNGSFTVKGIKVTTGSGDISYTNDPITAAARDDPNKISGVWGSYVPEVSNPESIKNAKAFLVTANELAVGDKLVFEITISPNGQTAGDIYRNRAAFNSDIDLPVRSNIVQTQVLGRDLTGYVWYDDDYDGLIGLKSDGSAEDPVGNIPVKLYRTSLVNGSYDEELVKESLTGQQFIDGAGDSLIKTDSGGKYKFENLPEGKYVAEFQVGDLVVRKVVIVTKQLIGSDSTKNSKADPDDYKTPEYTQPKLEDLPALLTGTDKVHHITDVNAGLTRLSKIRLFKYEEGTVIDSDESGTLEPEEIEAETTNGLEGAEFQLYKGKKDDPDTIKNENKIGTIQVTDKNGWLEFASLSSGFYTIVETKAPVGFELLKNPIEVEVPTYNYIAIVRVPDHGQSKLPFTGGTKAMRIILITATCLLVIGMTGVFLHFRPIKVRGGK